MRRILLFLLPGIFLLLTGCGKNTEEISHGTGLFSWHSQVLEEEESLVLFDHMTGFTELYQCIPEKTPIKLVRQFTQAAAEKGISVYLLTGDPGWALDPKGTRIVREIRRAASLPGIRGVVMDVEPYLLDEWDEDPEETMADYVQAMSAGKQAAQRRNLELIACIPWYLDSQGLTDQLALLTENGCHAMAVMNYYRADETEQIRTEAELCQAAEIPLIQIYELQQAGTHGLRDDNTYYSAGMDAARRSFAALQEIYPGLSCAFHDYDALLEVMKIE